MLFGYVVIHQKILGSASRTLRILLNLTALPTARLALLFDNTSASVNNHSASINHFLTAPRVGADSFLWSLWGCAIHYYLIIFGITLM